TLYTLSLHDALPISDPVAAMWFTTTKLRRFYTNIVNLFRNTFAELVNKKIPQTVLTAIRNNASAFTPNPLFNIDANPNNYDALGDRKSTRLNSSHVK